MSAIRTQFFCYQNWEWCKRHFADVKIKRAEKSAQRGNQFVKHELVMVSKNVTESNTRFDTLYKISSILFNHNIPKSAACSITKH